MLTLSGSLRVFLALEPCDMRKSFDGLHAEVDGRLGEDPRSGAVFVFINRSRNLLKLLHWDGTGLWVHAKRLERGTFQWPKPDAAAPADPGPAAETPAQDTAAKERASRRQRDLSHLPVEETVLTSEEVVANPEAYRLIERLVTDRLDYQPGRILIQRTVREVHIAKDDPDAAPVKPAAPPSLGLAATPRFAAYVTASKYCHHRPHYRTEDILLRRHGVRIPRHTLCHSDKVVADTLEPLYKLIHQGLLQTGNLQADETPVKYLDPGKGKTSTGYFRVIHGPRCGIKGDILYQWHSSRKAACLDELLPDYQGNLQTDAYAGYAAWAGGREGIDLASCWAHARREFHEALKIGQRLAAGPAAIIARLYQIETGLRESRATAERRAEVRRQQSTQVLEILKGELIALRQRPEVLPKSRLGRAIDYTLTLWDRLLLFVERGEIEIDNNLTENGIRPTQSAKRTGCLSAPKPLASAPPSSTPWSNAPSVTATIPKPGSPTFWSACPP